MVEKISGVVNSNATTLDLEKRKENIIKFIKKKKNWVYSIVLGIIIIISTYIRTLPMRINPSTGKPGLWDITTNTWTLGPDLDPFLFLRWAKYIVEHGKLFVLDAMRSVPLADFCKGVQCAPVNPAIDTRLLPSIIVGLYKILSIFSKEATVTYAAIILPVIMFALTIIAFFLFARKVFYKKSNLVKNTIAIVSTLLFSLVPSLLPRTIAGIPEKESAAFLFIFLSFYFLLEAFTSEKMKRALIFAFLSGLSTALLGLISGAVVYVFVTITVAVLVAFLLGKIEKKEFYVFAVWMLASMLIAMPFSLNYSLENLITSTSTGIAILLFFVLLTDFLIFKKKIFKINEKLKKIKIPEQIISIIIAIIVLVILAVIFFGFDFIIGNVKEVVDQVIHPLYQTRFSVTVAENKQPYFTSDWRGEFGPVLFNIPLFFWLFFIGSIVLFNHLIEPLHKKEKRILTLSYLIFLFCLIFSRYSPSSVLNGDTPISLIIYLGGFLFFAGTFAYFYYKRYKNNETSIFKELNLAYILYFVVLTITIMGARGAIRLIMFLGALAPLAVGFLIVKVAGDYFKEKESTRKILTGIVAVILIIAFIFTVWNYYKSDVGNGANYIPGPYQWQWQNAMKWVRDNTPQTSVFAHWWDYGYWVQSIGERATILDGGNAIGYWNYFMGRLVLTGANEREALDFLYAHNGTHLLIDSTEIGKYTAFSSIGSNPGYDRLSWISSFLIDDRQTQEMKDGKTYIYTGGTGNDGDIIWSINGTEVFLPGQSSSVLAILLNQKNSGEISQPQAVFGYNGKQYFIPMRYAYFDGQLKDFQNGIDAGVFIFPTLEPSSDGRLSVDKIGALLYLSPRTIHSNLAQLYLFSQNSNYFKLVHTESDIFIKDIRNQGISLGEFVYYQGLRGPIKIWSIKYPAGIKKNQDYLETDYPNELQNVVSGEYSQD